PPVSASLKRTGVELALDCGPSLSSRANEHAAFRQRALPCPLSRFIGCILSTGQRLERTSQAFRVDAAICLLLMIGPWLALPRAHQFGWWDLFHLHARQKIMAPPAQRESNSNGNLERRGKLKRVTREESQAWHVVSALAAGVPQTSRDTDTGLIITVIERLRCLLDLPGLSAGWLIPSLKGYTVRPLRVPQPLYCPSRGPVDRVLMGGRAYGWMKAMPVPSGLEPRGP
ncbi:hypothetical protein GQ607_007074, partial [Colletotrichum asianum]